MNEQVLQEVQELKTRLVESNVKLHGLTSEALKTQSRQIGLLTHVLKNLTKFAEKDHTPLTVTEVADIAHTEDERVLAWIEGGHLEAIDVSTEGNNPMYRITYNALVEMAFRRVTEELVEA